MSTYCVIDPVLDTENLVVTKIDNVPSCSFCLEEKVRQDPGKQKEMKKGDTCYKKNKSDSYKDGANIVRGSERPS